MLRYRRYRVFVIFAVLTVLAFYHFSGAKHWETPLYNADALKHKLGLSTTTAPQKQAIAKETKKLDVQVPAAETSRALVTPPPIAPIPRPSLKAPPPDLDSPSATKAAAPADAQQPHFEQAVHIVPGGVPPLGEVLVEHGEGRLEVDALPSTISKIHWVRPTEHFPVSSTIQLPTGSPKPIPKVQHVFMKESAENKVAREARLLIIKQAFQHAWSGYKKHAWGKDELSPVSANYRNPFNGWGATLVDALDTLWIMGLKEEFEEAATAVGKIDFTTSIRADIPLFETTIRYLGGLIAAYDVSNGKYRVFLDKAVELAEVLMGAFDTPNRMPVTFYHWKPVFASQAHRATTRATMSEIGSLSVEFTRLAQLTKEPKYYDAIARITDAFQEWQNHTRLPGMWPLYVDASGCERQEYNTPTRQSDGNSVLMKIDQFGKEAESVGGKRVEALHEPNLTTRRSDKTVVKRSDWTRTDNYWERSPVDGIPPDVTVPDTSRHAGGNRQLNDHSSEAASSDSSSNSAGPMFEISKIEIPECIPHGLNSPSIYGTEQFSLGGQADSTYEYLPKQYLLLGGLVEQYRTMYEYFADVAIDKLLFRPMVKDEERSMLISGQWAITNRAKEQGGPTGELRAEGSHLTCFVGGMFAMSAKIFERKEDLDVAAKLTDGCVWAYESMTTGIMPESFRLAPCESRKSCPWNETKWWDLLDPYAENRQAAYEMQLERMSGQLALATAQSTAQAAAASLRVTHGPAGLTTVPVTKPTAAAEPPARDIKKRQVDADDGYKIANGPTPVMDDDEEIDNIVNGGSAINAAPVYIPSPPPTHEEFVKARIKQDRIPPGFTTITDKRYILRPEAIESVFYMYRISGAQRWRDDGWRMFEAIERYTRTEFGHSAIDDVTSDAPRVLDQMESFWLAETLKYFYLLFCEEDYYSLDEWVFNTEAHPFRRPVQ